MGSDKIKDNPDTIAISEMIKQNFSKSSIYEYICKNCYEKVGPGLYVSPDTFPDDLLVLHKRCPNGVISHDEALYYYGLTDREPLFHTITVYSGYNTARLKKSGYKTFYVKKELLNLGRVIVTSHYGHNIPMYNPERTIVDLIRNRSRFEIQDFNSALKNYVSRSDKDLNTLSYYAKEFNVDRILRNYLEVLL